MTDYKSTTSLPDDQGKALLGELCSMYSATFTDENGKKLRSGSLAERGAVAALQKAIIDAALRFDRHEEFTAWLGRNGYDFIDAYDPLRREREISNELYSLKHTVEWLTRRVDDHADFIQTYVKEKLACHRGA